MCPVPYYDLMRQSKDPRYVRLYMVRLAQQEGIKPVARIFGTTPKTVRKWLRRYQQQGYAGLRDQSRAPKQAAGAITPAQKRQAIRLKKELPSWGAGRIKRDYELALSEKALRRIWREQGLLKKKRRKHKTKNDLRAIKQQWRLFEQISMDTKDLNDIPELWPQIRRHGLPTVQYTAREVVSGLQFIGYAQERSLTYARLFARLLVDYLQSCGVSFRGCRIQTDNGAEFVGSWNAQQDSAFTQTVQSVPGLTHQTIPPGAHTWQADVETVHRIIEDELYEVETFSARDDFLQKATTYNLWFNLARKNSYKNHQSPWEIVKTRDPTLAKEIVAFPPLFLDELFVPTLQDQSLRGYDLIPHPYKIEYGKVAIMRTMLFALLLTLNLLFAPQQPLPRESGEGQGFKIDVAVEQVFLSVNARSVEGGFVRGLSKEDFGVFEDGVKQEIVNFYSEAVPVHVVLLIDVSGSTRRAQGAIRRAALRFAESLGPEDKVAIIIFNDQPRLILNWTNELKKIQYALGSVYAKGRTVLNDALYVTFDDLLNGVDGRKAVILMTDGVDTESMVSSEEVMGLAVRSEAMVYIVSKLDEYWAMAIAERMRRQAHAQIIPRELTDDFIVEVKRNLRRLAQQTGGKVLDTESFASLSDVYALVAEELKNQYYVSYIPSNVVKDGRWRQIEIHVIQPSVIISTRPGYYARFEENPSGGS